MAEYTVEWVGDKTHDYKDQRTYSISVKDNENAQEFRKVKLELPQTSEAPAVGSVVFGSLDQHPRFDDAKLLRLANGSTPSDATGEPQSDRTGVRGESTKDEDVARAGAYNNAISIVAAGIARGHEYATPEDVLEAVESWASKFLPSRQSYFKDADPKPADDPSPDPIF